MNTCFADTGDHQIANDWGASSASLGHCPITTNLDAVRVGDLLIAADLDAPV